MQREEASALIATELEPILGRHMARAAVDGHCANLGLVGAEISASDLEQLLRRIGLGLCLFVGRDKADGVVRQLRQRLDGGGRE